MEGLWKVDTDHCLSICLIVCLFSAGVDYIPTSGSLTLSGLDVVTFNVTLLDDRVLEPEKTFNVMLTISDSPANVIPGYLNCSISIDDDGIVKYTSA